MDIVNILWTCGHTVIHVGTNGDEDKIVCPKNAKLIEGFSGLSSIYLRNSQAVQKANVKKWQSFSLHKDICKTIWRTTI